MGMRQVRRFAAAAPAPIQAEIGRRRPVIRIVPAAAA